MSAKQSADIAGEQLRLTRELADRAVAREVEDRRPQLVGDNERGAPGAFHLHDSEVLEFSGWLLNQGTEPVLVERAQLVIDDNAVGAGLRQGVHPVANSTVAVGGKLNVHAPSSAYLMQLVNSQERAILLEVLCAPAGMEDTKWWLSLRLVPIRGQSGGRQWLAESPTSWRAE
jgi:hypothetical protein